MSPAVAAKASGTCPGTISTGGGDHIYLGYAELRHDSRQWDIRLRETSRQHESCLLIRADHDSHWMGQDSRGYGEGSIYRDEANGTWVGAISLGWRPDGKRIRRKVTGLRS